LAARLLGEAGLLRGNQNARQALIDFCLTKLDGQAAMRILSESGIPPAKITPIITRATDIRDQVTRAGGGVDEALPDDPREDALATLPLSDRPVPIGDPEDFHQGVLDEQHIRGYHQSGAVEVVRAHGEYNEALDFVDTFITRSGLFSLYTIYVDLLSDNPTKVNIEPHPDDRSDKHVIPQITILKTQGNPICKIPVDALAPERREELIKEGALKVTDAELEIWAHASDRGLSIAEVFKSKTKILDQKAIARLIVFELLRYMAVDKDTTNKVFAHMYEKGLEAGLPKEITDEINRQVDARMQPQRSGSLLRDLRGREIAMAKKDKGDTTVKKQSGGEGKQESGTLSRRDFLKAAAVGAGAAILRPVQEAVGGEREAERRDELEMLGERGRTDSLMRILIQHRAASASARQKMDAEFRDGMNELLSDYYKARDDGDTEKQKDSWQALAKITGTYLKAVQDFEAKELAFIEAHPYVSKWGPKHPRYGKVQESAASLKYIKAIAAHNHAMAKQEAILNEKLIGQDLLFLPEAGRHLSSAQGSFLAGPGRVAPSERERRKIRREQFEPVIGEQLEQKIALLGEEILYLQSQKKTLEAGVKARISPEGKTRDGLRKELGINKANGELLQAKQASLKMLKRARKAFLSKEPLTKKEKSVLKGKLNAAVIAEQRARVNLASLTVDFLSEYHGTYRISRGARMVEPPKFKEKRERLLQLAKHELKRNTADLTVMPHRAALGEVLYPSSVSERNEALHLDDEYGSRLAIIRVMAGNNRASQDLTQIRKQANAAQSERTDTLDILGRAWAELLSQQRELGSMLLSHSVLSRDTQNGNALQVSRTTDTMSWDLRRLHAYSDIDRAEGLIHTAKKGLRYFAERQRQVEKYCRGTTKRYNAAVTTWLIGSHKQDTLSYFDIEGFAALPLGLEHKPSRDEVSKGLAALEAWEVNMLKLKDAQIAIDIDHMKQDMEHLLWIKKRFPDRRVRSLLTIELIRQHIELMTHARHIIHLKLKISDSKTGKEAKEARVAYKMAQVNQALLEFKFSEAMLARVRLLSQYAKNRASGRGPRAPLIGVHTIAEYFASLEDFWARKVAGLKKPIYEGAPLTLDTSRAHPGLDAALKFEEPFAVGIAPVKDFVGIAPTEHKDSIKIMLSPQVSEIYGADYTGHSPAPTGTFVENEDGWFMVEQLASIRTKDGDEYDVAVAGTATATSVNPGLITVVCEEGRTIVAPKHRLLGVDPHDKTRYLVANYLYAPKDVIVSGKAQRMVVPVGVGIRSVSKDKRRAGITANDVRKGTVKFEKVIMITEEDTYKKSTKIVRTPTKEIRFYYVRANPRLGKPASIERERKMAKVKKPGDKKKETKVQPKKQLRAKGAKIEATYPLVTAGSPAIFAKLTDEWQTISQVTEGLGVEDVTVERDLQILTQAEVVEREGEASKALNDRFRISPELGEDRMPLVREYLNYLFAEHRGNVTKYTRGDGRRALTAGLNGKILWNKIITDWRTEITPTYQDDAQITVEATKNIPEGSHYTIIANTDRLDEAQIQALEKQAKIIQDRNKRGITITVERKTLGEDMPNYTFLCEREEQAIGQTSINLHAHSTALDRTNAILNIGLAASAIPPNLQNKRAYEPYQPLIDIINRQYKTLDLVEGELIKPNAGPRQITDILHTYPIAIVLPPIEKPSDLMEFRFQESILMEKFA